MPPRHKLVPAYRPHKQSGLAIVTIRLPGKKPRDVTLGKFNSPESLSRYQEILASLQLGHDPTEVRPRFDATVNEVIVAFWKHAEQHYRRADGTQTNELVEFRFSFKCLRKLCGSELAALFGPMKLQAVREEMVRCGWSRKVVNARVRRLKHVFKWAASQELVPGSVYHALLTVAGLQKGRTKAPDHPPVEPIDDATVEATLPLLSRQTAGMVRAQRLIGCRPDEVCTLRMCEVDQSGGVWKYRPPQHKRAHRGEEKVVYIGPRAQAVLQEFMPADPTAYVFSPRRAVEERNATRSAARKTPLYDSHKKRNEAQRKAKPKRQPRERYTTGSYDRAIARAVVRAGEKAGTPVKHWAPNQLRHARATEARSSGGLESAQAILSHQRIETTQIYAERNQELAEKLARESG